MAAAKEKSPFQKWLGKRKGGYKYSFKTYEGNNLFDMAHPNYRLTPEVDISPAINHYTRFPDFTHAWERYSRVDLMNHCEVLSEEQKIHFIFCANNEEAFFRIMLPLHACLVHILQGYNYTVCIYQQTNNANVRQLHVIVNGVFLSNHFEAECFLYKMILCKDIVLHRINTNCYSEGSTVPLWGSIDGDFGHKLCQYYWTSEDTLVKNIDKPITEMDLWKFLYGEDLHQMASTHRDPRDVYDAYKFRMSLISDTVGSVHYKFPPGVYTVE